MRLEIELRRAMKQEVSGVGPSEDAWSAIEHRLGGGSPAPRGSRAAVIGLALTLSAASLVGLWLGFRSDPIARNGREVSPGEPVDLQPRVTAVVPVGAFAADVAVGEGAVWVSVPAQEPQQDDLVVRVDSVTNQVAARIPVEGYVEELAAGAGGVWGAGIRFDGPGVSMYVDRIDPATNEVVARIQDVSAPLAVGAEALWAVDRAGARAGPDGSSLLRIDPETNGIVATIPLGVAVWDIEYGEGYVWVLSLEPEPGEGDILQVDPSTNEVVARIEIPLPDTGYPPTVYAPALGEGSAWVPVCCDDNELILVRIDVTTGQVVGEPFRLPGGAPFAVAAGHVWFVEEGGALYGLNVATSEVDEVLSGFDWPAGGFPDPSTELDHGQLAVWVVNANQGSVTRIDLAAPTSGDSTPLPPPEDRPRVTATIPVGSFPRDIAVGGGAVWVSVNDFTEGAPETHAVLRVDPSTNEIVARIPVDTVGNLAVGFDAVWTIDSIDGPQDSVVRIDPATNQVTDTIPIGPYAFDVAVDTGSVWVTRDIDGSGQSGEVIRIDPTTNEVVARIPVSGRIRDVVVGEDGVWVVDSTSTLRRGPSLIHIDPQANEVVATIPGLAGLNVTTGGGLVWMQGWLSTIDPSVGTGSGDRPLVLRIDPATDQVVGDPIPMSFFHPFAVWEGGVWFVGEESTVSRLSMEALEVDHSVVVDAVAQDSTVHATLDISTGTIWVANYQGTITRIDL